MLSKSDRSNIENKYENIWWKQFTSWTIIDNKTKTKLRNTLEDNMSADIRLSKTQISKIIQSGRFLDSLLSKITGPLMKVVVQIAKNVLFPLGITAGASAIDAGIQKKIHRSGATPLTISNEEINDMMKIVQALEDSNILLKRITETISNKTKEQNWGFLGMLLGTLGASLLRNMLTGKGILKTSYGSKMDFNPTPYFDEYWNTEVLSELS